jgi:hypothetical protein
MLAGGIDSLERHRYESGSRAYVDDAPIMLIPHDVQNHLSHVPHAKEVGLKRFLALLRLVSFHQFGRKNP